MQSIQDLPDISLFLLCKEGDVAAYEVIFRRYHALLYRHACKMLQEEEAAHDVVQEVFRYLWKKRASIQLHTSLSAYLYRSVRHGVLNEIKRSKRQIKHIDAFAEYLDNRVPPADEAIRLKQLQQIIDQEIDKLPPRMREIFLLRRQEELTYKEIAEQLGISDLTVKTQLNKAAKILKSRLLSIFLLFFISSDTTFPPQRCLIDKSLFANEYKKLYGTTYRQRNP